MSQRFILHVDMDAFYAAIEQRDNPDYRNKAVVIGSDPTKPRGVVSTCSYEAREFGVRSAMPISKAYQLCPQAIFVRPNMDKYIAVSKQIFNIFGDFSPHVEGLSVDEAFIDITGSHHLFGGPLATARLVKARIKRELGLTASVGLAPNKSLAKIASDLEKPDGLTVVEADAIADFLRPLDLKRLWGVGPKTLDILKGFSLKTIGDLEFCNHKALAKVLGDRTYDLLRSASGQDDRPVQAKEGLDSISNEHTFMHDVREENILLSALMYLSQKVSDRLRFNCLKGKTISIKVRLSDFSTYTRSKTINSHTNYVDDIYAVAQDLLDSFLDGKKIRLIGVKVSNWKNEKQYSLDLDANPKKEQIHQALDDIKGRFGKDIITRARAL